MCLCVGCGLCALCLCRRVFDVCLWCVFDVLVVCFGLLWLCVCFVCGCCVCLVVCVCGLLLLLILVVVVVRAVLCCVFVV